VPLHDLAGMVSGAETTAHAAAAWMPTLALSIRGGGGLDGAWAQYLRLLAAPDTALFTKAVSAAVIIGAGDASAQVLESALANRAAEAAGEAKEDATALDWARVGRWAAFGLLLQAPWNHFFYQVEPPGLYKKPQTFQRRP